ncbi:hypothetical protein M8C21_022768 [Ambrosia artemisiifolia]|uniref:Uncharacterized protein n=1 Tax=Ambrosia artemisiifolia TaxID=4212 RepID=A0AAD5GZ16_AMBAR|nr:hypothetical protein M8C21_022768 [Ambrosia artemisiifolia]
MMFKRSLEFLAIDVSGVISFSPAADNVGQIMIQCLFCCNRKCVPVCALLFVLVFAGAAFFLVCPMSQWVIRWA